MPSSSAARSSASPRRVRLRAPLPMSTPSSSTGKTDRPGQPQTRQAGVSFYGDLGPSAGRLEAIEVCKALAGEDAAGRRVAIQRLARRTRFAVLRAYCGKSGRQVQVGFSAEVVTQLIRTRYGVRPSSLLGADASSYLRGVEWAQTMRRRVVAACGFFNACPTPYDDWRRDRGRRFRKSGAECSGLPSFGRARAAGSAGSGLAAGGGGVALVEGRRPASEQPERLL